MLFFVNYLLLRLLHYSEAQAFSGVLAEHYCNKTKKKLPTIDLQIMEMMQLYKKCTKIVQKVYYY